MDATENKAVVQVSTLAEMEAAQIDQQIATAKRYPRNEMQAIEKSIRLATYNAKVAQGCIYMRPVGKKDGKQTFAQGPSIRLAEVLKSSWGNLRLGTRVVGEKDGNIHVQAVCHDLENNIFEAAEVAKSITGRNGRYPDTMIQVVISAASKIALRNVIFSVIPKAYTEQIMDACKQHIVGSGEDKAALMSDLIASFDDMGVGVTALFSAVDRKDYPAGSNDEIVFLIGLHNAIKDGICSVDDVFGKLSSKPVGVTMPVEVIADSAKQEIKPDTKAEGKKKAVTEKKADPTFADTLRQTALQAGIKGEDRLCKILIEKFEIQTPEEVPPEMMGRVIDHFIALQG